MHINELSSELLVLIFSKIDDFSQKSCLGQVCRHWRRIAPLNWETTKTCPKPLNNRKTVNIVLNRFGEWLEELWLRNIEIDVKLVKRMAIHMKCFKDLKLSKCKLDGPALDSIIDLFGQQLYSFVLDYGTPYQPNMSSMIENESSNLEHLSLNLNKYYGTLPTKLPSSLKSFTLKNFYGDPLILIAARDCKNLKILHLETDYGTLNSNLIWAIGNVKSLIYLNLVFNSIENESALKNVICSELPNLKALRIGAYCSEEIISNISRDRPDLVYLNVCARQTFQIADSLKSLTLHLKSSHDQHITGILLEKLLIQENKSLQYLDIRYIVLPCTLIEKLIEQFPNLNSLHCKMPTADAELISFFTLMEKHLKNERNITIYFHAGFQTYQSGSYYKYYLPRDFPPYKKASWNWRPNMCGEKCENLVLKKIIREAINGKNVPSFFDDWWME